VTGDEINQIEYETNLQGFSTNFSLYKGSFCCDDNVDGKTSWQRREMGIKKNPYIYIGKVLLRIQFW
jgi:hypothetical protein